MKYIVSIVRVVNILLIAAAAMAAQTAIDGFQADISATPFAVARDLSDYYVGGTFTTVNGTSRNYLARLKRDGSVDNTYNPAPNSAIQKMIVDQGGRLIVAGSFTNIGGGASGGIARLNTNGTNDNTFTASVASIAALAIEPGGKVLVGGHFTDVNGTPRNRLARFNADGTLDTSFAPNIDSAVFGIAVQPDGKILIAGQFNNVNGQPRWRFARLNPDGSLDVGFFVNAAYPGAGGVTYELAVQPDGKIIVCGSFTRFADANVVRNNVVRLNKDGTIDTSFTPNFNGAIFAAKLQPDGRILLGGNFTTLNGAARDRIARLNMDGSPDTGFGGSASDQVGDIEINTDGAILLCGSFTSVNGTANINRIANLYPDGRLNADMDTSFLGSPPATMVSLPDGKTIIGGGFTSVGGAPRQGMARITWSGANDTSFANPQLTGGWVNSIGVQSDGKYIAGGDFTTAAGTNQAYLARFTSTGVLDGTFSPTFNSGGWVSSVAIQPDGKVLISGQFTTVNGVARTRFARLNSNGSIDTSFANTSLDSYADCMALQADGKIIIGGAFSTVGGQARTGIARLNANGTLDTSFNPIINGVVYEVLDIKLDKDGKILIAGGFPMVNGVARTNIARLNTDGSLDASLGNANIDGAVQSVAINIIGNIFIAGDFQNVGGVPHSKLAMLNSSGTVDAQFLNTTVDNKILAITLRSDAKLLVGGYFTSINGQARGQFGAVRYSQPPIYDLYATDTRITWYRWWYAPEVTHVTFERSIDGVNYTPLGNASRQGVTANWILDISNANATGFIRARAYAGDFSDRQSAYESVKYFYKASARSPFDFDGDGKTDIGIFRPTGGSGSGEWWINKSATDATQGLVFGSATDKVVSADFTGDGKTDIAFFRASTGEWFVLRSEDLSYYSFPFGANGDVPVPADYDGDGKADAAVFRPSSATWFIQQSTGGTRIEAFGLSTDRPVPTDYDGDGKADIAIYRPSGGSGSGEWWVNRSTAGLLALVFGSSTDKAVPGDYTGDGKADIAFWRPSTGEWYVLRSENLTYYAVPFGAGTDLPVPGDYDGDGKYDTAVFRPSDTNWYIQRSTAGTLIRQFGVTGDRPIPNSFVP